MHVDAHDRHPSNVLFDWLAPVWDLLAGSLLLGRLLSRLPAQPPGPILDLGGGTGRLAARVAARGDRALVADLSLPMVRRARTKGLPAVQSRGEALPFADGSIGAVLVLDALHHMGDLRAVAHEAARVLAPGGMALLVEPDPRTAFGAIVVHGERWLGMGSLMLDAEGLGGLFAGTGLDVSIERERGHIVVCAVNRRAA